MMRTCPRCKQQYDPETRGARPFMCRNCATAENRRQRERRKTEGNRPRKQEYITVVDNAPVIWRGWCLPYDEATKLMLTQGDFPPGCRVRVGDRLMIVRGGYGRKQRLEVAG